MRFCLMSKTKLKRAGIWQDAWGGADRAWFAHAVDLIRPGRGCLSDFATWARAFFTDDFDYEAEARAKFWKDERLPAMLAKLADALEALPEWNHDACDAALRALAAAEGVKAGLLINATRVAIVGRAVAPASFRNDGRTRERKGRQPGLRRALPFGYRKVPA